MNINPWLRLHGIVEKRISHLGLTRDEIHANGGPSSEWIRGLKERTGRVTVRQVKSLLDLDAALGWNAGTSRNLIDGDRSTFTAKDLDSEAYELAETNLPEPEVAPTSRPLSKSERQIHAMQTIVARKLRNMDPARRRKAMEDIARLLDFDIPS